MGISSDGLIAAGGDLASSVVSGLFGQHSAKASMAWQERMANTAYQRAARDLEKAGLNRILAVGSPAATPGGATATMPDAKLGSAFQAGSSARTQRNLQDASRLLVNQQEKTEEQKQITEKQQQALLGVQASAIAQKVDSEIALNAANAQAAITNSKRGSGVAEISAAIAKIVKQITNPEPGKSGGIIPTVIENLPSTVLGKEGEKAAGTFGKNLYEFFHGSIEQQSNARARRWSREDADAARIKKHGK